MKTPLIIITRDRRDMTVQCVESLLSRPGVEVHIVDHGSTYRPMLNLLERWDASGTLPVHWLDDRSPRDLWAWDGLAKIVGEDRPYLVTDPDVVLDPACPDDWLEQLRLHLGGEGEVKVGLGLRIDDLPQVPASLDVTQWEGAFWKERAGDRAWRAPVDTTLALYPPLSKQREFRLGPAIRLDAPYLLRHLPWYETGPESEELAYYREHALPGATHWTSQVHTI